MPQKAMRFSLKNFSPAWACAILTPLAYLFLYTPYGMDTTDFGYFYAYAWRILQGEVPYRDFSYIKPALPLYWHAFWLWLTPENFQVLGGKAGFLAEMLASAWFAALYLQRLFNIQELNLPLPLLATTGFVFGIHSFPHMPWHTADGVLFLSASLWLAAIGHPLGSGLLAACAMLCKQSFLLAPAAIACMIWLTRPRREALHFALALACAHVSAFAWLHATGAWENFRTMTTGQLAIAEALDAGIFIYLRQNWLLPALAALPWLLWRLAKKNSAPAWLMPCYCYLVILAAWHILEVFRQKTWLGYGLSWPTLFMLAGGLCVLFPKVFLAASFKGRNLARPELAASLGLCAALLAAWSTAISGGYKIPAFLAAPLLFSFYLLHARLGGDAGKLAWGALCAGLLMFWAGYQYPYVFPVRPLKMSQLTHDAGQVYAKAGGVMVDADMLARLEELKWLRAKYGPNYKTLPGFSFAYYLNGDKPVYGSDWLIDWEINGEVDRLYKELLDKNLTVFMERDQMDTKQADAYERAGYGVPQRVRKYWRIVEETPHFVIFQPPKAP